ncbi:MAG: MIP/aquaporin family protein, partial [Acidobacteriaceae bacterium]
MESAHEWRRLFAETWGTFLLVVVAAGSGVVGAQSGGAISLGMKVVAPGLMVMAIIYFMGAVSGAHLNPAVTLAFALRRNFPWSRVPGYITAQIIGGIAAASFLRALFGIQGLLGATTPGPGVSDFTALAMEVLLTTGLVSTILGTAYGARNIGSNGALAVGGYISLAGLWAAPISGASMNPVRSFAPDLIRGDMSTTWIFVVGPVLGTITIDTDTTVHTLFGNQMGARKGYNPKNKGKKSYQPILSFIAETREYAAGALRSGDRLDGREIAAHLDAVAEGLSSTVKQVYARADSGFYCREAIEAYEKKHWHYIVVARKTARLIEQLQTADWKPSPKTDA